MGKKQHNTEGRKYLSGAEAARRAKVAARTVYRWVERGWLHAHHNSITSKLEVAVDDLEAFLEKHPPQDAPEEQLNEELEHLKGQIQELLPLKKQVHYLQEQVDHLVAILAVSATNQSPEETADSEQARTLLPLHEAARLLSQLRFTRSGAARSLSVLERRGLPPGTMTVSDFARLHQVKVHTIKKLFTDGHIKLSIVTRREYAIRNKQEWWIKPQEQRDLIGYWQAHGIAYTMCSQCPHEAYAKAQAEQLSH